MSLPGGFKFRSMGEFWEYLPGDEFVIVDFLREIVLENLPRDTKERLAYNVPCYYGRKRICLIWPASVPRGGIKTGVLFGLSQGYRLKDVNNYLIAGPCKILRYKIFHSIDEIDQRAIVSLLKEAVQLDASF
jgi:hypothetical protein